MDMTGKTAMITGASRGIGAAAARELAKAGANVVLLARSEDSVADLAGEIGPAALAIPCDVAKYWQVDAAVEATLATFGRLDVLINNAGVIAPIAALGEADPDDWGQAIDINLKGVFHGIRAALPAMVTAGGGTIITVSSGAAHNPVEAWSAYSAAKAGAAMLTRSLHHEYAEQGIRALSMSPGTVATDMQRTIKDSGINPVSRLDWSSHVPPEWPARCLLWMCGPGADDRLGQEISLRDEEIRVALGLTG